MNHIESNPADEMPEIVKKYTWSSFFEIGPEKSYFEFNKIAFYFSKLGYLIYVKLTNNGWSAEAKTKDEN